MDEYKGYKIQINESEVAIINGKGEWVAKVPTPQEAIEWIDEHEK